MRVWFQKVLYIPFWLNLYLHYKHAIHSLKCLYIPFWLNLYKCIASCFPCLFELYIPFWLNLYPPFNTSDHDIFFTLHSILVKSIHVPTISSLAPSFLLYIPFWLNLYALSLSRIYSMLVFTFHSG